MLPELNKKKETAVQVRNSQPRLDFSQQDSKDMRGQGKALSGKKVRTGGGFMKSNYAQQIQTQAQLVSQKFVQADNYSKVVKVRRVEDLSAEIKLIERKIKACQKKLEDDRRKQRQIAQEAARDKTKPSYNFEKVVERELQMQGYRMSDEEPQQNFDYLTNPKLKGNEDEGEPAVTPIEKPLFKEQQPYNIEAGVEKLEKFYENSLKRKFERREMFPHQACRRKTPKLYITQKTNALNKYGKAQNEAQHLFRVLTKQTTPQQIYPTIPNFAVVKDSLSKNIVAYLGDYKPFLDKTKQGVIKSGANQQQNMESTQEHKRQPSNAQKIRKETPARVEDELKISVKSKTKTNQKLAVEG